MNNSYIVSGTKFEISDEIIEYGDFFLDIKKDGSTEPYIHQLINGYDYIFNGIDVITLNKNEFDWNKKMIIYKKIINI
jgi:hypothetical protein